MSATAVAIPRTGLSPRMRLFVLSFLMLFVELLLIRWAAANVIYLAYFTNFVLLASFLGVGLGFLRRGKDPDPLLRGAIALTVLLIFIAIFPVSVTREGERTLLGLFGTPAIPLWVSLPLIFVGVTAVLTSIAQAVADVFGTMEPLDAYRFDILGSLAGITVFSVMSFAGVPPLVWGLVVSAGLWWMRRPDRWLDRAWIAAPAVLLVLGTVLGGGIWSPYYRVIHTQPDPEGRVRISVNGLPHQATIPMTQLIETEAFYFDAYEHLGGRDIGDVLIVGAGNGNDVSVALAQGADHVDAVEIDPVIRSIGDRYHPQRPYQDPRVEPHIDDGRAFLERTDETYDLILFALPDSLTVVSGQGSLRLESYLFTTEALRGVREHLNPGGAFSMYNYYRADVFDRFAATITEAFGHPPCIDRREESDGPRHQAVLTVGREPGDIECTSGLWTAPADAPLIATDDRPFPYLEERTIPSFYLWSLGLIVLASVLGVRWFAGVRLGQLRPFLDLFCMGVAFLLLEAKYVVHFALLFGTTWFVNALVFAGILLAVYLAVEVTRRFRLPKLPWLYAILAASLVAAFVVPTSALLSLPAIPRFLVAVALAFAPVFTANLVFSSRFREAADSTVAFGANLLGAMIGGVLEYAAIVVGYRNLVVLVALAYLAAFLLRPRTAAGAASPVTASVRG
jgi:hypothetical protein